MKKFYVIFNVQDVEVAKIAIKDDGEVPGYWLNHEVWVMNLEKGKVDKTLSHLKWILNGLRYVITKEKRHL